MAQVRMQQLVDVMETVSRQSSERHEVHFSEKGR